ncbi:hypothetical protein [Anaerococcus kampingiae]|uniref:Uncharacterized protein n=1 Tax=Anaerococcus kampingae TaxID=3115614 RepID=A0ABW9MEI3_9FIRM
MKKILQIFLIAALSLSFVGISYAQDAEPKEETQPVKEVEVEKPADKIKIKEDTKTLEEEKVQPLKEPVKEEVKKQGEANSPESETKEAQSTKDVSPKKEAGPASDVSKKEKADYEKVQKAVDDLVEKLDKNSNLAKALEEVKVTIKANNSNTSTVSNQVNKKTEKVIKDYSQKIQEAKTPSQKRQLENEAANKIKSISIDVSEDNKANARLPEKESEEPKKRLTKEVKANHNDDISKIYALAPAEEEERDYLGFLKKPVVIVAVILVISILISIGIVIRNKEKNDIDSY